MQLRHDVKTILFPTDFSDGSAAAVPYVLDLSRMYGARVVLLHVVYDIAKNAGWYASHMISKDLSREMETRATEELERYAAEVLAECPVIKRVVRVGTPCEDILACASDEGADLIVIGSHGRKGIERVLLGSTTAKVVRHAACAVLTVRRTGEGA